MDAKVTWKGKLSFTGTADSGYELPLGARAEVGGDEDGFRPMELMALSLAACTAMDVVSIIEKKREQVTAFEVQVHVEREEEHPRVFTGAVIEYEVTGHKINEAAVVRSIELSAQRYCAAQAMLSQVIPIEHQYVIYEDEGAGQRRLVTSGKYLPSASEVQM